MKYHPGVDAIIEEILIVGTLAQCSLVSLSNLRTVPYFSGLVTDRAAQLLMEKLLAISIKVRFLDDSTDLLKKFDRRIITIGKYTEDGVDCKSEICIRNVLNKLVHHKTIDVSIQLRDIFVTGVTFKEGTKYSKTLPPGSHKVEHVMVAVEGYYSKKLWRFEIDLFILLEELLRVFELSGH